MPRTKSRPAVSFIDKYGIKLIVLTLTFLISIYAALVVHELGHLAMALLVHGCEKGVNVQFILPFSGIASCKSSLGFTRQDMTFIASGGMLATGVVGAVSFAILSTKRLKRYFEISLLLFMFAANFGSTFFSMALCIGIFSTCSVAGGYLSDILIVQTDIGGDSKNYALVGYSMVLVMLYAFAYEFPVLVKACNSRVTHSGIREAFVAFATLFVAAAATILLF